MEADGKPSDRDTSQLSDPPSDSDSSSSDVDAKQTEWLATTRERRATAGNRMKTMLANEEPDSDMELLFAEDGEDQGFSDANGGGSDINMDSSSDDEGENNANDDDMEGEKELERQAKEKRAAQRKRKAQEAIPAKFRKKVRIDPTTPSSTATGTPAPRPKKKSERASWLPSQTDLPTRSSSRSTTRISKEQLHQQMVEREARRLKQQAQMEKKARSKEAKRAPMTQEERLAEAAIVEERNSKSLNRWEEAEKQREEERRAKLAALNQRTLKGPVITSWSGKGQWNDVDLRGLRPYVTEVEDKPKKKREKSEKGVKGKDKDKGKKVKSKEGDEEQKTAPDATLKQESNIDEASKGDDPGRVASHLPKTTESAEQVATAPGVEEKLDDSAVSVDFKPETATEGLQDGNAQETAEKSAVEENPEQATENLNSEKETVDNDAEMKDTEPAEVQGSPARQDPDREADGKNITQAADQADEPPAAQHNEATDPPPAVDEATAAPVITETTSSAGHEPPANEQPANDDSNASLRLGPESRAPVELGSQPSDGQAQATATTESLPGGDDSSGHNAPESSASALPNDTLAPDPLQKPSADAAEADTKTPLPNPQVQAVQELHPDAITSQSTSPRDSEAPAAPPPDPNATRNAILFQNFNGHVIKDRTIQTQILFGRKMNKLSSKCLGPQTRALNG